jgi:hypothetical protein
MVKKNGFLNHIRFKIIVYNKIQNFVHTGLTNETIKYKRYANMFNNIDHTN